MNEQLAKLARTLLKEDLAKLTKTHQTMFKRIYSRGNLGADIKDIKDIVDAMPDNDLDWVMLLVERSLDSYED